MENEETASKKGHSHHEPRSHHGAKTATKFHPHHDHSHHQEKEESKIFNFATGGSADDTFYNPLHHPPTLDYYEKLEDFKKYKELAEQEISTKRHRCYVYFGDQKGFINMMDLTHLLRKRDILPVKPQRRPDSYQLKRKEWIDVSKTVESSMSNIERLKKPVFNVHSFNTVLMKRWEVHSNGVTNMIKVPDPKSFITCSPDKHVKVFGMDGELLGDINLVKLGKNIWNFPFNWGK
mmetsp:Transcript_41306/g.36655  ORF Transcript_41306/g.36655 Transcript_41306/m.36655 type:complete len:235 (-) Transcript_41306:241-945(-)